MAAIGTATGAFANATRHWVVTITALTGAAFTSVATHGKGFQNSSFVMQVVSGTAPTNIQPQGSNDGGTTWVNIGVAPTSFPAGGTLTPSQVVFELYQYVSTGGDATTNVSIVSTFVSSNAS